MGNKRVGTERAMVELWDERDRLRAENEELHGELRQHAICWYGERPNRAECGVCGERWSEGQPERHAPDCLARPRNEEVRP